MVILSNLFVCIFTTARDITKTAIQEKRIDPPFRPDISEIRVEDANNDDDEEQVLYTGKIDFSTF
jgi:hypothetical protein